MARRSEIRKGMEPPTARTLLPVPSRRRLARLWIAQAWQKVSRSRPSVAPGPAYYARSLMLVFLSSSWMVRL